MSDQLQKPHRISQLEGTRSPVSALGLQIGEPFLRARPQSSQGTPAHPVEPRVPSHSLPAACERWVSPSHDFNLPTSLDGFCPSLL